MKKKIIFFAFGVALLAIIAALIIYFVSQDEVYKQGAGKEKQTGCLGENEIAIYENDKSDFVGKIITIVKNKQNNKIVSSFSIDDVMLRNYHPAEVHKCGIYVLKSFNDDYKLSKALPGFSKELWFYDYEERGKKIIPLAGENELGDPEVYYSYDFRVSPNEKYVFLIKSYLGKEDYALVIKDLNTLKDLLVLNLKDILEKHPDVMPGSIGLGIFTPDGRYFWGDIYDGARETAYYRIEMGTWKTEVLPLPKDIPAGVERAWSFSGYVAYADFPTFFGIDIVAQQEQEKFKEEDREKHLYLYNLRTKEKKLLASTPNPEQRFNIKWISDTELQYQLPNGEIKIYEIKE
jgi:hypothetical protein